MLRRLGIVGMGGIVLACGAEAPTGSEGAAQAQSPIVNGTFEPGNLWAVAVVNFDRGTSGGLCTGTVVAADVVLTAKHCVNHEDGAGGYLATPAADLEVRVGSDAVNDIQQAFGVLEVRTTPGAYTVNRILDGDDIALLLLDGPVVGVIPAAIATTMPNVGDTATIVGYGVTDPNNPKVGPKYTGTTQIVEVGTWLVRTLGDSWTCQGDSGGPLLVGGIVSAVTSAGRGGCVHDADHLYTALAPHQALLAETLGGAMTPSCDQVGCGAGEQCFGGVCMPAGGVGGAGAGGAGVGGAGGAGVGGAGVGGAGVGGASGSSAGLTPRSSSGDDGGCAIARSSARSSTKPTAWLAFALAVVPMVGRIRRNRRGSDRPATKS